MDGSLEILYRPLNRANPDDNAPAQTIFSETDLFSHKSRFGNLQLEDAIA